MNANDDCALVGAGIQGPSSAGPTLEKSPSPSRHPAQQILTQTYSPHRGPEPNCRRRFCYAPAYHDRKDLGGTGLSR